MRALLAIGFLVTAAGIALLAEGVRQQVAWTDCTPVGRSCVEPSTWPVTVGILTFIGGGFSLIWTLGATLSARVLHPGRYEAADAERLRRVGLAGRAHILRSFEIGRTVDERSVLDVELSVEVAGREAYLVRHRTLVPRARLPRITDGRPLPVLIDPNDPTRLVVEWDQDGARDRTKNGARNGAAPGDAG